MHGHNPSTWEVEVEDREFKTTLSTEFRAILESTGLCLKKVGEGAVGCLRFGGSLLLGAILRVCIVLGKGWAWW